MANNINSFACVLVQYNTITLRLTYDPRRLLVLEVHERPQHAFIDRLEPKAFIRGALENGLDECRSRRQMVFESAQERAVAAMLMSDKTERFDNRAHEQQNRGLFRVFDHQIRFRYACMRAGNRL